MESKKPALIVLDRDGVINEDSDDYIKSASEWKPIAGSIDAIKQLKQAGIPVAIATNQSGLGRGFFGLSDLNAMHDKLYDLLGKDRDAIHYLAYCPHLPLDDCDCRKPNIGLLTEISQNLNIQLDQDVYFVGDSLKDMQAAKKAGCRAVLVLTGKGKKTAKSKGLNRDAIQIFTHLQQFVESIL